MRKLNLKKGLKGVAQTIVNKENSAKRFTDPMIHVFATPMLISLMDTAAINAVKKYLPEGYTSVATKISISHLAATPIGMSVTAEAILTDILKNRLTFKVTAYDEMEKVGEGSVERYIVDLNSFAKKIMSRKGKNQEGEF